MLIIDDVKNNDILHPRGMGKGLIVPSVAEWRKMAAPIPPSEMEEYPESEWIDRVLEYQERKRSLYYIWERADKGRMPENLYQNGDPLCWGHSTTNAVSMARARDNMPYEALSAYALCYMANGGQMSGGWCGQSAAKAAEVGIPSQRIWPQQQYSGRLDTPEMREDAARHRITEGWRDGRKALYAQRLTKGQLITALLNNHPCAMDDMEWAHSVCGVDLVIIERGSIGVRFLNSWGEQWGDNGFGVKRWENVASDGAIAIMSVTAA